MTGSLSGWLRRLNRRTLIAGAVVSIAISAPLASAGASPPPIRLSANNQVPDCVTPDRLMRFLKTRNRKLLPTFRRIADWYKYHGESWQVRWDYAFYQMAIETNFLTYRAPNGRWGDVNPKQNNFAGIGTTGGGVPGDGYSSVSTGVLAQIQHLVVYSGERIPRPVAPRTRLKQDHILHLSRPVAARRPVTFQDLSGRWAVDKRYGRSIEHIARLYRKKFCRGGASRVARKQRTPPVLQPRLAERPRLANRGLQRTAALQQTASAAPLSDAQLSAAPPRTPIATCKVQVASYGGDRALLIRSETVGSVQITALDVQQGYENAMARDFIAAHASGGREIARFATRSEALNRAHQMCKDLTGQR